MTEISRRHGSPHHRVSENARVILDSADVNRVLTRIAHEIVEANKGTQDLVLLGIPRRVYPLAQRIAQKIASTEPHFDPKSCLGQLDITMYRDDLRRNTSRTPQPTRIPAGGIDGKNVVLVDDVQALEAVEHGEAPAQGRGDDRQLRRGATGEATALDDVTVGGGAHQHLRQQESVGRGGGQRDGPVDLLEPADHLPPLRAADDGIIAVGDELALQLVVGVLGGECRTHVLDRLPVGGGRRRVLHSLEYLSRLRRQPNIDAKQDNGSSGARDAPPTHTTRAGARTTRFTPGGVKIGPLPRSVAIVVAFPPVAWR